MSGFEPRRLIRARSRAGLSIADLARASMVAAAQISRYENGSSSPRTNIVMKLAVQLQVPYEWLAGEQGVVDDLLNMPDYTSPDSMPRKRISEDKPKFILQYESQELCNALEASAASADRSINAELNKRLRQTFESPNLALEQLEAVKASLDDLIAPVVQRLVDRAMDHAMARILGALVRSEEVRRGSLSE